MKRLFITSVALLSAPAMVWGAIAVSHQQSQAFTTAAITFASESKGDIPFDLDPGGVSVFRFGLSGSYSVQCKNGKLDDFVFPNGASLPENGSIERLCSRISATVEK